MATTRKGCLKGCAVTSFTALLASAALSLVAVLLGVGFGAVAYNKYVVDEPGPQLDRSAILASISRETTVYYGDGQTRVGVFFSDQHRSFIEPQDLPAAFALSIVAAEDSKFWSHHGVDPLGIARAMGQNLAAGRVVAGGSTLSQQTAKNIFKRPDRSIKSKLGELLNTLRLEAHFDKRDILTFYANQFHVAGNGRGLGIASRYFFDVEDPSKLSVLQSAYIAGLVKGPSNYDPWLGDAKRRKRATQRAHERTRYVLRRLAEVPLDRLQGPYDRATAEAIQSEARQLITQGFTLPFRRGSFRYQRSVALDELSRRLKGPPFAQLLADAGIDQPETAGLVIYTTLDEAAQHESLYALRHHLTEVGIKLEGPPTSTFIAPKSARLRYDPDRVLRRHDLLTAKVVQSSLDRVLLDSGGAACELDQDALKRAADALARGAKKNKRAKATRADRELLRRTLKRGVLVQVSVRDAVTPNHMADCDLEALTELQGAVAVVQDGKLRAMVGGSANRDFNRARAGRQMGSTWKPLVFHAAIELGWRPEDMLENWQNTFPWAGVFYWPNADHKPLPAVTMAMAGVRSENVASVWLAYHLVDKLDATDFATLVTALDLAQRDGESLQAYRRRVRGKAAVVVDRQEAAFLRARDSLANTPDTLPFADDQLALRSLLYGRNYEAERTLAAADPKEGAREWKARMLDHSWTTIEPRLQACTEQYARLRRAIGDHEQPSPSDIPDLTVAHKDGAIAFACGRPPEDDKELFAPPTLADLQPLFPTRREKREAARQARAPEPTTTTTPTRRRGRKARRQATARPRAAEPAPTPVDRFHQPWSASSPEEPLLTTSWGDGEQLPAVDMLWVDGRLHVGTLNALTAAITPLEGESWSPQVLYYSQDFRVLVGLDYIVALARAYGVQSEIREVLPLPLGASEITVEEAASLYAGLVQGVGYSYPGRDLAGRRVAAPPDPTLLIQQIRDASGRVLYQAEPEPHVVARPETGAMVADILRSVVEWGTGRAARRSAWAGVAEVPLGGKTGTTNDFRNAAFMGYAPTATDRTFGLDGAFTIAVYVGYDDNRSMRSGNIVLAGASGALPVWRLVAQGLGQSERLGSLRRRPRGLRMPAARGLERRDVDGRAVLTWSGPKPPLELHFSE